MNDQGEYETCTEWHSVYAWSKLVNFTKSLQKGLLIALEGTVNNLGFNTDLSAEQHLLAQLPLPRSRVP